MIGPRSRARRGAVAAGVAIALATGCHGIPDRDGDGVITVAFLGDSNGDPTFYETFMRTPPAPARVAAAHPAIRGCSLRWRVCRRMPMRVVNLSSGGTTMTPVPDAYAFPRTAMRQLAEAFQHGADVVVAAFGTNDLGPIARSQDDIRAAAVALQTACALASVPLLLGTVPPGRAADNPPAVAIEEANERLRATFATHLVDLTTGFDVPDLFADALHFNAAGQAQRAARFADALEQLAAEGP